MSRDGENVPSTDLAIGARIRARRKSLGLSQAQLAAAIGVSFQQVQKYERATNRVSGSTLVAVAARLGVTVAWLVGEEGEATPTDEVFRALALRGALEMLEAYAAIADPRVRTAVLELARGMGHRPKEGA